MGLVLALPARADDSRLNAESIVEGLVPISGLEGLPEARSVDLTVEFDLGAADLTAQGEAQLDALGAALEDPRLNALSFDIIGHTDASGDAERNLELSELRAVAVALYLVQAHGIAPDRLSPRGEGETRLKNPLDPNGAENRRVEIMAYIPRVTPSNNIATPATEEAITE
ncbi:OmpA family protein [Magnetospira thiophila]